MSLAETMVKVFGGDRLAKAACDVQRKKMAESMSEGIDDLSVFEAHRKLEQVEDAVLEESDFIPDDTSEDMARLALQSVIISTLSEGGGDE